MTRGGTLSGRGLISSGEMGGGGEDEGGGGLIMVAASSSNTGRGSAEANTPTGVLADGKLGRGDITKGVSALPGDKSVTAAMLAGEVGGVPGDVFRAVAKGGGVVEAELIASSGGGTPGGGGRLCCRYTLCRLVRGVSLLCAGSEKGLSLLAWAWGLFTEGSDPTRCRRLDSRASAKAW